MPKLVFANSASFFAKGSYEKSIQDLLVRLDNLSVSDKDMETMQINVVTNQPKSLFNNRRYNASFKDNAFDRLLEIDTPFLAY